MTTTGRLAATMTTTTTITYADLARPEGRAQGIAYDAALVLAGSALVALGAQLELRLPFTPVPVTGQTFAVLLVGALLGAKRGALALLAYLAEGAAGMPVFAGGAFGATVFLGPTGGYLFGFVPAALVTGALAERGWDRRFLTTWAAMALGSACLFACGLGWLYFHVGRDLQTTLAAGFWPFLPADIAKQLLAAVMLPGAWRLAARRGLGAGSAN